MKKVLAMLLAISMVVVSFTGCGNSSGKEENQPTSGSNTTSSNTTSSNTTSSNTASSSATTEKTSGERQKIDFWYHASDEETSAMFEEMFTELNAAQDEYEYVYTGFANKNFPDAFATAIATNTMPDVVSLSFANVMTYVAMNALKPMQNEFEAWEDSSKIVPSLILTLKSLAGGENLYGVPYGYNQEMSWYNASVLKEKGIKVPETQAEFLALCEEYADEENGKYFYSLRGNKPYDNLLGWLFTYTDGLGYGGEYFDENGNCIISAPEFAEAMDAYVNIYKNGWVSGDCVNNGFNEMVAEFGAGTALYIMHNSSSEPSHKANLGEGNYGMSRSLKNENGRYFTSALQPQIFSICNKGEDVNYDGAMKLIEYFCSAENMSRMNETMTKVPTNMDCYDTDWVKNSEVIQLCMEIAKDENFIQVKNPYWLTSFFPFINGDMTTDFQAVLLGEMTSQDCLNKWAKFLTDEQAAYVAGQK